MKKITYILLLLLTVFTTTAQVLDPVKWTTKIEKKSDTEYVLVFDAVIEPEWHMYSQYTPEGGVNPLEVLFNNNTGNFEAVGKAEESKTRTAFNDIFEVDETFWENTAQLRQNIKITNPENAVVQAELSYQVCKNVCIQQNKLFEFDLNALTSKEVQNFEDKPAAQAKAPEAAPVAAKAAEKDDKGLWATFFLSFLGGLAALLTPCVFPMIPMTVSFFTKQSKSRSAGIKNAVLYGISIIIIYVGLGSLVTAVFGIEALNELSTNVWFNLIFFVLLIVFAFSFLGAFEIVLPNSWANKVDRQADRGGFIGILFMALALAIVSFSCTGPIVGGLLFDSASKGGIAPVIGMLGFSLALALPFMLFAMFPGWLNSLPKSGGWLNTVKVFLGFLELAFAFKFLSNADLVLQLHLLEREAFLAIWIAIFGAMGLYLIGKIHLPHDTPQSYISVGRLSLGILTLAFTIYLIPGLFGAPLKLISGFPPPLTYSESPMGIRGGDSGATQNDSIPEGAEVGVHGIISFHDYQEGLDYAKRVNKPLLIDFTGHACPNCRRMEENVWSDPAVLAILKNDIVLVSLYGDDKRELPENEQHVSKATGKKIKTIGNKWTDFQTTRYNINSQPYYVLVGTTEQNLHTPVGYTPDIEEYKNWLKEGIANYK